MLCSAVHPPLFTGMSRTIVNVDINIQDVYQDAARNQLIEVLQDCCCLQMLLASMKEKKVTPQAWIQVCSARDHPNAIPQSILICALCLYAHLPDQL